MKGAYCCRLAVPSPSRLADSVAGAGNMAVIHPSEIFAEAIKEHASAIVVSHNHPSGNPTPSSADIKTTHDLVQASQLLGIALLDHIILGKNCYFSFLEHDMLV